MLQRAIALTAALLAASSLVAAARSRPAEAEAAAVQASGNVQVANSKNGSAILSGALGPGDSLSGTVTISNVGSAPGNFTLALSNLADTPGSGGGFFSRTLDLVVHDVSNPAAPVSVYSGPLNSLNPTALGTYAVGAAHTYRFVVRWVASVADATMPGSSMSVEFDWSAADAATPPTNPGTPVAAAPPAPSAPGPLAAPRLTLALSARQAVARRGAVAAVAGCDQDCTLTATGYVSLPGSARSYKLTPARRNAKAGSRVALKLRLARHSRARLLVALRTHRKAVAPVTIQAVGRGGAISRVKRKVRVTG